MVGTVFPRCLENTSMNFKSNESLKSSFRLTKQKLPNLSPPLHDSCLCSPPQLSTNTLHLTPGAGAHLPEQITSALRGSAVSNLNYEI